MKNGTLQQIDQLQRQIAQLQKENAKVRQERRAKETAQANLKSAEKCIQECKAVEEAALAENAKLRRWVTRWKNIAVGFHSRKVVLEREYKQLQINFDKLNGTYFDLQRKR